MKTASIEPGLLSLFRRFTALRLGLTILGLAANFVMSSFIEELPEQYNQPFRWFVLADAALLMAYLSWPALQRRLGSAFLPLGLTIATVGPILEYGFMPRLLSGEVLRGPEGAVQLFLLLFIPLVLIGWQYDFRSVILFSLSTALVELSLVVSSASFPSVTTFPLVGLVFIRTIAYILVGYMVARLMTTQREQRQALAAANTRLTHYAAALEQLATSRERNRLARELHDTLAHSLSGVAVQLEAVKTVWETNPDEARSLLEQSLAATRNGLTETRRALQALRASALEDLGLALAIRSLAESVAARNDLNLDLELPERLENLSPDLEQGIYRIAQEALENVSQHAQAQNVQVRLSHNNDHLVLAISDDGRGFDLKDVDPINQFGIQGMRERIEMLGGDLEVESQPERGTTIRMAWRGSV